MAEVFDWQQCVAAVRSLEGRALAVRVALRHRNEELTVVIHARLGRLAQEAKRPSLFWPLGESMAGHVEQPGIYLREQDFKRAEQRAGGILVIEQADVILNLRPLDDPTR